MPHSGDDETSRRGWYGAVPNSPVRRGDGRGDGDGGDGDGGDGGASYARRAMKRLTGGAGLPARESAREGAAGRWGRLISEREGGEWGSCARAGAGRQLGQKGGERGREGEAAAAWAGFSPAGGRGFSLFLFIF
jgi:hypothetical protein